MVIEYLILMQLPVVQIYGSMLCELRLGDIDMKNLGIWRKLDRLDHDAAAYPLPSPSSSSDAHWIAGTARIFYRSTPYQLIKL